MASASTSKTDCIPSGAFLFRMLAFTTACARPASGEGSPSVTLLLRLLSVALSLRVCLVSGVSDSGCFQATAANAWSFSGFECPLLLLYCFVLADFLLSFFECEIAYELQFF